jgi:hypothetical protein
VPRILKAEQVIELVKTLDPVEIERLFVLFKEYELEVRRRQASTRYIPMDDKFKEAVDRVFAENDELFRKLAEYERKTLEK